MAVFGDASFELFEAALATGAVSDPANADRARALRLVERLPPHLRATSIVEIAGLNESRN